MEQFDTDIKFVASPETSHTELGKRICILANQNNLTEIKRLIKEEQNGLEASIFKEQYGKPPCTALDGAIWNKNKEMVFLLLDHGSSSSSFVQKPFEEDWLWYLRIRDEWVSKKKTWRVRLLPGRESFELYEDFTVLDFKKLIQTLHGDDPDNFDVAAGVNVVCDPKEFMSKYRNMGILTFYLKKPYPQHEQNYLLKKPLTQRVNDNIKKTNSPTKI